MIDERQLEVVGVDELDSVAPPEILEPEHRRQRTRVPEDVELLVEEQGELALLPTQRH